MLDVVFSYEAESDLNEIGEWYKVIREGLDQEFLRSSFWVSFVIKI